MQNTFWTLIEDGYYRVFNGELKYAPKSDLNGTVASSDEIIVQSIDADKLELINSKLGSSFLIASFN